MPEFRVTLRRVEQGDLYVTAKTERQARDRARRVLEDPMGFGETPVHGVEDTEVDWEIVEEEIQDVHEVGTVKSG